MIAKKSIMAWFTYAHSVGSVRHRRTGSSKPPTVQPYSTAVQFSRTVQPYTDTLLDALYSRVGDQLRRNEARPTEADGDAVVSL
jgi:hypothetical protein